MRFSVVLVPKLVSLNDPELNDAMARYDRSVSFSFAEKVCFGAYHVKPYKHVDFTF